VATWTAHAVGGAFFRPEAVASRSEVGIGTLLGGGDTEYIEYSVAVHPATSSCPAALFLDGDAATTMGADATTAGFLGLRAGAGQEGRCCGGGDAWRCAGRGRSGGCGNGLRAIVRVEFNADKPPKDFKPLSISVGESVSLQQTLICAELRA